MSGYHKPEAKTLNELKEIANKLRIHSITATTASKSGHPTSCSSMAELMSVLFFHTMRYKVSEPRCPSSDRLVLSKGHAAPILYAAWAEAGLFPISDLANLRRFDSDLEGHPTPRLNFIDVGTGSLGQGLAVACGMAYVGKYFDKASYRTYCLLGDGESAEGSVWESLAFASHYRLDNLCVIVDVNRLGQSEQTALAHDMEAYRRRVESFGHQALVVDGHDVEEICKALHTAATTRDRPTCVLAKTYKGRNFPGIEDADGWHGKPLLGADSERVIKHLRGLLKGSPDAPLQLHAQKPLAEDAPPVSLRDVRLASPPEYRIGEQVATRNAYGAAVAKLARAHPRVIALDADMKNSTFSERVKAVDPARYIECYIAEQNLVGVAVGAACRDRCVAFVSTFATFLTRAFDQIRMGAISQTNVNFAGSHCGVSIGEDGPSQMGLEDLAMFRSVPGCTVFYPSDAVSCERAVELAANTPGMCYIRLNRPATTVLYKSDDEFHVGRARVLRQSDKDDVLVVGAGITLHEALKAHEQLTADRTVRVRVMDPFTVKPLDSEAIVRHALECGGRVVTVEDHYAEGGLGEAVLSALAGQRGIVLTKLAVPSVPRSGPPATLIEHYGISANHIAQACRDIAKL